uniref:Uncharacterized protein n=1 Tax=Anopheles epiroticus TaxID=199890 RepID=A0A182PTC5_9DIPT
MKNNLTAMCVKKLLRNIVGNEHVFAMVQLKAEEEAQKSKDQESKGSSKNNGVDAGAVDDADVDHDDDDDNDEDNDKEEPEPKLTRLKAKQLKQIPLPIASLNEPTPDDEVAALIREELCSDDDDEEYKPTEDDIVSDDDQNITVSDVDSQPRTPASVVASVELDNESEVQYTTDGLFKIPKPRNDSLCSQSEQDQEQENIALRTRSKLCLTTTAIETIESTFVPPDITKDMYEYDGEMDQAWKDFLEEFTKPLLDREEMRSVKVSKKELNELVQELMEMGSMDDQTLLEQTLAETINESLNSDMNNRAAMLTTPVPQQESNCIDDVIQSSVVESNTSASAVPFPVMSVIQPEPSTSQLVHTTQQFDNTQAQYHQTMYNSECVHPETNAGMVTTSNCTVSSRIDGTFNSTVNVSMVSSVSGSQNGKTVRQESTPKPKYLLKYSSLEEVLPDCSLIHEISETRYRINSSTVPMEVSVSEKEIGMNDIQFQLLHQQLRMHVQLTTQHFLQTYAHPTFWNMASKFKDMLTELTEIGKTKPNVVPWNLPLATECCQSWEDELAVDDANTRSLLKYWTDELKNEQKDKDHNRSYRSEFHWLVREKILNCRAFIYPSLIPYKPFRNFVNPLKNLVNNSEKQ